MELYNPGDFSDHKGDLIWDVSVNVHCDLTKLEIQEWFLNDIEKENPLVLISAPPCTVFSSMQNINRKHNQGEEWDLKYQKGLTLSTMAVQAYWSHTGHVHQCPAKGDM